MNHVCKRKAPFSVNFLFSTYIAITSGQLHATEEEDLEEEESNFTLHK
jgi:hypothetical protein